MTFGFAGLQRPSRRLVQGLLNMSSSSSSQSICPLLPSPVDTTVTAEFAMGWFWGPQRDFDRTEGIVDTVVGYSGSAKRGKDPTYRNVQDYAESIRITFDPNTLDYAALCAMFFGFHTPSDPRFSGTQYRSAIFYCNADQKSIAEAAVLAAGALGKRVALEPASDFYRAEEYHQRYIDKACRY